MKRVPPKAIRRARDASAKSSAALSESKRVSTDADGLAHITETRIEGHHRQSARQAQVRFRGPHGSPEYYQF